MLFLPLSRWSTRLLFLILILDTTAAAQGPSLAVRQKALKSLVYIRSSDCPDGDRAGSGFVMEGQVVTAHHVVGGCGDLSLTFEGVSPSLSRVRTGRLARVLAKRDLALLQVDNLPSVPSLTLAEEVDESSSFAGFGYQNGQPSAGDIEVRFSTGSRKLSAILPNAVAQQLASNQTKIDLNQSVLRFNTALQPGMSGGPIIDKNGDVIGVVAGGLKAGAAPASWGWPTRWVIALSSSSEPVDAEVKVVDAYYSLKEMRSQSRAKGTGRAIACGKLNFLYMGTKNFSEVSRGADDQPRLQYLLNVIKVPSLQIETLKFDLWTNSNSGSTVVVPSGYDIARGSLGECVVKSPTGPFSQIIWSASTSDFNQVQQEAAAFENLLMFPRAPYLFGFQLDLGLTSVLQQRPNGLIFSRKGFTQPKAPMSFGQQQPLFAHTFETLIAKAGVFVAVGTIDDTLPANLQYCASISYASSECAITREHVKEWSRFILATQLSTFPAT